MKFRLGRHCEYEENNVSMHAILGIRGSKEWVCVKGRYVCH
jgi:hypothetical protein